MFEVSFRMDAPFAICSGAFTLLLVALCLFGGCHSSAEPALAGTFVNQAKSEFSIANDTLVLQPAGENQYLIYRKTGIRMINENGQAGKLILESEEWKAVYDKEESLMTESSKGRLLRFSGDSLWLENSAYRRIE